MDQLILGALFFTVLVFLFPTVMVYYILFSIYRVGIIFVQGLLEIVLALLNHFPLFSILLRFKDPYRVSSGIGFEIYDPDIDHLGFNIFKYFRKHNKYDYADPKVKRSPRRKKRPVGNDEDLKEINLDNAYLIMKVSYF